MSTGEGKVFEIILQGKKRPEIGPKLAQKSKRYIWTRRKTYWKQHKQGTKRIKNTQKRNKTRIAHDWKSCVRDERTQGSNPWLSARRRALKQIGFGAFSFDFERRLVTQISAWLQDWEKEKGRQKKNFLFKMLQKYYRKMKRNDKNGPINRQNVWIIDKK